MSTLASSALDLVTNLVQILDQTGLDLRLWMHAP